MIYESSEQVLGLGPGAHGGVSRGLALTSFGVTGTQLRFFLDVLVDPERSCCPITGWFGFASRGEMHVHYNHVVGAVCLIGVYG